MELEEGGSLQTDCSLGGSARAGSSASPWSAGCLWGCNLLQGQPVGFPASTRHQDRPPSTWNVSPRTGYSSEGKPERDLHPPQIKACTSPFPLTVRVFRHILSYPCSFGPIVQGQVVLGYLWYCLTAIMMDVNRTFSDVRKVILSAHKSTGAEEKVAFYNDWASYYEQDVGILEYRAPSLAAELLSAAYRGNRDTAAVLDVACGTGLVCSELHNMGFRNFFGVDGSHAMLDIAKRKGLYKELKQCMLGMEPLPVQAGSFDAVLIVGALSAGNVSVAVVKELWQVAKPGGFVCMTTRANVENLKYKTELENIIDSMEQDGLWVRVDVREVEQWERAVSDKEAEHISGVAYLYRKSSG